MIKAKIYLDVEVTLQEGSEEYRFVKSTQIPAILPVDSVIFLKGDGEDNYVSEIDCKISGYQWFEGDDEIHIETIASSGIVLEEENDQELIEWLGEMKRCGWQEE